MLDTTVLRKDGVSLTVGVFRTSLPDAARSLLPLSGTGSSVTIVDIVRQT